MVISIRNRLARLGRWPRRIAALLCLALAAVSAFAPPTARAPDATARTAHDPVTHQPSGQQAVALEPGQVAVAVRLADGGAGAQFMRPGDRIDLIAGAPTDTPSPGNGRTPVPIVDVGVLAVRSPPPISAEAGAAAATEVVVALSRRQITQLAGFSDRTVFAALDKYP
ncbi:MAG: RcpC/CpaB family pilus assembly protein [Jatrophihabitantaceae bacterium]